MIINWNRRHKHCWVSTNINGISTEGNITGEIRTYQCYSCGSIRYDTVDAKGFSSSVVTDNDGKIVSKEEIK